ncbi:hypothetical protein H2200_010138 [Cladophialophora chaetospira]|uniref:Uncharacterized protein n=1 Tax=Cladophialophora chaetospira TaxID=386627 RepID=A0AA39CEN2_9EURO|nr:hypothetical protein H2200_010138 [Cladophialophora chaetospira]
MAILDRTPAQFEFATFNSLKMDAQRPVTSKAPFLFIVKTPDSDTLSRSTTRSAAASINSHAQRWAQEAAVSQSANGATQKRETETLAFEKCMMRCRVSRLLEDPAKPVKGRRSGAGKRSSRSAGRQSRKSTPQPKSGTTSEKDHSTSPEAESESISDYGDRTSNKPFSTWPTPSPSPSGFSVLNPFEAASLANEAEVQPILQYYLSFALLSTPKEDDVQQRLDGAVIQHCSSINTIIRGCMHKEVHMYALLAATASRMRRVSGVSFRADNGPEIYLHKALQCLRMLLDNSSSSAAEDCQIILDIYLLSICGWYLENYAESKTHFNVLKHFWKTLIPGRSTLYQYIYDLLNYNVFLEADLTSGPLPVRPGSAGKGTFRSFSTQPTWRDQHCSALAFALQEATYSPDLKDVVEEMPLLLSLFKNTPRPLGLRGPEMEYIHSMSRWLTLRLLELPSYGGELCCRLALVILLRHMHNLTSIGKPSCGETEVSIDPVLITRRLKRQLQYEILLPSNEISPASLATTSTTSTSPPHIWTGKSDPLLLWVLITGMFGARLTHQKDEYHWFWARAKPLLRLLGISTMSQLNRLLGSFVLVEGMLEDRVIEDVLVDEVKGGAR